MITNWKFLKLNGIKTCPSASVGPSPLRGEEAKQARKEGKISIKDQLYTLKATSGKRELLYDSTGKLIGTKPFRVIGDKIVK